MTQSPYEKMPDSTQKFKTTVIQNNAASIVPITVMQVGLHRLIQKYLFQNPKELSEQHRINSAFASSMSCPLEMIITPQAEKSGSFYAAGKYIVKQSNWRYLFSGLPVTAMRESMFSAFFLVGAPMLKAKMQQYCSYDYATSLMAGIGAGIGATLASQGFDTLRPIRQDLALQQPVSLKDTVKKLYSTEGIYGFFKGGITCGSRIASAIAIMDLVSEKMDARCGEHKAEHHHEISQKL
jgi:solute carrier family 25 citrate transporter 1